eukprot:5711672-Amphidinium_carterae.1
MQVGTLNSSRKAAAAHVSSAQEQIPMTSRSTKGSWKLLLGSTSYAQPTRWNLQPIQAYLDDHTYTCLTCTCCPTCKGSC